MKVLFLDIDGVLNSERTCLAFNGYPHSFFDADIAKFDHVAIALVRKLCAVAGASIVLSTSWRYEYEADVVAAALDLPVIGATPQSYGTRGLEINAWLGAHPEVTQYAIVDDISQFLESQQPFFVQTDEAFGLTLRDYSDLLAILNRRAAA